ncbi:Shedu anti-phage system protein SduA domain-containing protein [Asticcacaulis machinosus]|uniref:DUF4263 domain-containing protein n=1 Tax=Asticcacaulis machinosus TaxID=2984211 RepID=A0ABT5HFJ4_9CAUL|nr:Shedu anti-phage system protein SduA domain-containing protein [Asticcacaulis machinosus]MDC7674861.1 DUF4263 domain-containing protein [Asticcacaulis machinosus]
MPELSGYKIIRADEIDHQADIAEQSAKFPGALYGDARLLRAGLDEEFETSLTGSEETIQKFLAANPYLLQYVIPNSGHHGTWVFPKKMIRTKRTDGTPGLIPDYLVATQSSLGYHWHIVELKLASVQFAKAYGKSYSRDATEGIAQCATYISHFTNYIETVRSNIGVTELITPKNAILLMGDARNETEEQRISRSEFCDLAPRMIVASYDRIRRGLANDLRGRM